jgi:hypothetical protein
MGRVRVVVSRRLASAIQLHFRPSSVWGNTEQPQGERLFQGVGAALQNTGARGLIDMQRYPIQPA